MASVADQGGGGGGRERTACGGASVVGVAAPGLVSAGVRAITGRVAGSAMRVRPGRGERA